MGLYQIGNFCSVKEAVNRMMDTTQKYEKIFISSSSERGLISRIDNKKKSKE
jgi:hypothetical protein